MNASSRVRPANSSASPCGSAGAGGAGVSRDGFVKLSGAGGAPGAATTALPTAAWTFLPFLVAPGPSTMIRCKKRAARMDSNSGAGARWQRCGVIGT